MNIVAIVPYFYPAWAYGGPAKLVYDSSVYMASQGHSVTVLTSDSYDESQRMPQNLRIKNIPNLEVRYFRNIHNHLAYRYNIFFTPGFFLKTFSTFVRADIVHMHDFYTPQNAWTALICNMLHKPYILSVHGCLESTRMTQRSLFKRLYLSLFGRYILRHTTAVVATSNNEVEAYQSYGIPKQKIWQLQHGVDPNEFATTISKAAAKKSLNFPSTQLIVTFLGRLHAIKGLDLLVAAIDLLRTSNIHFVIAGSDDGYKASLLTDIAQRKLKDKITLLGTCFGEQKSQLFKASDIFVYPSYSEGFSLGVLEAAAAGLPLILTTGCHFSEVAKVGAGLVVPPDAYKLAKAIKQLAYSDQQRKKASNQAQKLIKQSYNTARIYDSLLDRYAQHV